MAMESFGLYNAAIALAAGHLSRTDPSYKVATLEAQSVAVQSLRSAIVSKREPDHDINTAICLLLLISEVRVGEGTQWYSHLNAARHFITSTPEKTVSGRRVNGPPALLDTPDGQWALHIFIYYDILAGITLRKTPLLYDYYITDTSNILLVCFPMLGAALASIAKLCHLQDKTKLGKLSPDSKEAHRRREIFCAGSAVLERDMHAWSCYAGIPVPLAAMSHTYHSAAFILYYRFQLDHLATDGNVMDGITTPETAKSKDIKRKIETHVCKILRCITKVPAGAPMESNLLCPLFIAGSEATDKWQRDAVWKRLVMLYERLGFQNVTRAMEVLEEVWQLNIPHKGTNTSWTQVLDKTGAYLLLV